MTAKTPTNDAGPEESTGEAGASTNSASRPEETRPLTVLVPVETLKRLKVVGILCDKSVSDLVCEQIEAVVRRDLKKALGKLDI